MKLMKLKQLTLFCVSGNYNWVKMELIILFYFRCSFETMSLTYETQTFSICLRDWFCKVLIKLNINLMVSHQKCLNKSG